MRSGLQEQLELVRSKFRSCEQDFGPASNVLAIVSCIISAIACIVLLVSTPKRKMHFPFILSPLLCASASTLSFGYCFNGVYLQTSPFTCFVSAASIQLGAIAMYYIWICSIVILYQATVLKISLARIRKKQKIYAFVLISAILIAVIIPAATSSYGYIDSIKRCYLNMNAEWDFIFGYSHNGIAVIVFTILAPAIIKTLVKASRAREFLARPRRQLILDEAVRQVILGLALYMAAILMFYTGIQMILIGTGGADTLNFIVEGVYSVCASVYICVSTIGSVVGLLFICARETRLNIKEYWEDKAVIIQDELYSTPRAIRRNATNFPSAIHEDASSLPSSVAPEYVDKVCNDQVLVYTTQVLDINDKWIDDDDVGRRRFEKDASLTSL